MAALDKKISFIIVSLLVVSSLGVLSSSPNIRATNASIVSAQSGLSPLHCEGRLIKNETGGTVFPMGVNKASFEWDISGVHFVEDDWVNIKSWGCNVVRLPFQQDWWMESEEYRARIDQAVAWGEKYGMYIILDNHWTNETYRQDEGRPHNWTTWINMWVNIAERYQHNSSVLFDPWNEPHDSDVFDESEWPTRAQQCVNAIRTVNPNVIIIISAMRWGNGDMNWVKTSRINGTNIVYTLHWYVHHTPIDDRSVEGIENWLTTMGWKWILDNDVAPVIVGECNAFEEDEAEWWINFLSVANEWDMSYLGWAWWPGAGFPPLLANDGQWKNPNFAGQILIDAILAGKGLLPKIFDTIKLGNYNELLKIQERPYVYDSTYIITALQFSEESKRLTLTLTGTSGQTGTLEVKCFTYGEPMAVYNATKTAYNSSTTIQKLSIEFGSEITVVLDWSKVTIKGVITDQNGSPIQEAKVTCNEYETLTNESGYYNFTNLETGNYTLKITKSGYIEKTATVNCPEGRTYTVNVSLGSSGIGTPWIIIAVVAIIVAIGLILVARKWK